MFLCPAHAELLIDLENCPLNPFLNMAVNEIGNMLENFLFRILHSEKSGPLHSYTTRCFSFHPTGVLVQRVLLIPASALSYMELCSCLCDWFYQVPNEDGHLMNDQVLTVNDDQGSGIIYSKKCKPDLSFRPTLCLVSSLFFPFLHNIP